MVLSLWPLFDILDFKQNYKQNSEVPIRETKFNKQTKMKEDV